MTDLNIHSVHYLYAVSIRKPRRYESLEYYLWVLSHRLNPSKSQAPRQKKNVRLSVMDYSPSWEVSSLDNPLEALPLTNAPMEVRAAV